MLKLYYTYRTANCVQLRVDVQSTSRCDYCANFSLQSYMLSLGKIWHTSDESTYRTMAWYLSIQVS